MSDTWRKCAELETQIKRHDTECELFDEVCQNTENVKEHCAFTINSSETKYRFAMSLWMESGEAFSPLWSDC